MSPVAIALLVAAAVLLVAAEWHRFGIRGRALPHPAKRRRARQKSHLHVVHPEHEEFARSVERDLAALPTIDEHDVKRR